MGDKRILLVDGEPVGAINRIPAEGAVRSNLHVGGTAAAVATVVVGAAAAVSFGYPRGPHGRSFQCRAGAAQH